MFRVVSILVVLGFSLIADATQAEAAVKAYKSKQLRNPTYVIHSSEDKGRMASSLFKTPVSKVTDHCEQIHFLMRGVCKAWLSFTGPARP